MKKSILILNGKSISNQLVRAGIHSVRAEGHLISVHVTYEAGDAERIAFSHAQDPNAIVIAAGGDGTVNEVLNGLMRQASPQCAMGILPLGTANDFATSAGIPIADPYSALKLAVKGEQIPVDVGTMNGRHFLNVVSGGFGAEVTTSTPLALKKAIGGSAYAIEALLKSLSHATYSGRLITHDQAYEGKITMLAVGNGRQAGGGAHLTPQALIDDGLLDVLLIPEAQSFKAAHLLTELIKLKLDKSQDYFHLRLSNFTIESDVPFQFNLDGEPVVSNRFEFGVLPQRLRMALPRNCALLSRT